MFNCIRIQRNFLSGNPSFSKTKVSSVSFSRSFRYSIVSSSVICKSGYTYDRNWYYTRVSTYRYSLFQHYIKYK